MKSVANLRDLLQGIADRENVIEVCASFTIDRQVYISYPVTIRGAEGALVTLQRQQGYASSLFYIDINGDLTLKNITVNGNKTAGAAGVGELISVSGGKLLLDNAVLEENKAVSGGGAVYLSVAGARCIMRNNAAVRNCEADGGGGGFFVSGGCSLTAINSAITGNSGVGGGGIYAIGAVTMTGSRLTDNSAGRQPGGGIYAAGSYCSVRLCGSAIAENVSSDAGGGIYGDNGADITVDFCTISGNRGKDGGGIAVASQSAATKLSLSSCRIDHNRAACGGGMYGFGTLTRVLTEGCNIVKNGAALGGGVALCQGGEAEVSGCTRIEGNTASRFGGGVYIDDSSRGHMRNCTIASNIASHGCSGVYNGGWFGIKGTIAIKDGVTLPSARHLIQIEGALSESQIQMEASDYVAPGSGAPIPLAQAAAGHAALSEGDAAVFQKPGVGFRNWKTEAAADGQRILLLPAVAGDCGSGSR